MPAIKDTFNTRILYSDISINDAYKNGYRVFRRNNYEDYPNTYGSITKLLEWAGYIICIFEHGAAAIPVNERAIATSSAGGAAFINTSKVLPQNPNILSNNFGSQWSESIVQTPYGIYGVDTVAKKIWKIAISGNSFKMSVISDFKVQRFLNENITLSANELTPIIGVRNVKTHYNAFKNDVMFTFYDDLNTLNEKAWNLCYNEILDKFITFYSWIPSYSENIDNIFFSFDRNASKNILCTSLDYSNPLCISIDKRIIPSNVSTEDKINGAKIGEDPKIMFIRIGILSIIESESSNIISNLKNVNYTFTLGDNCLAGFVIYNNELYLKESMYNELKKRDTSEIFKIPITGTITYKSESTGSQSEGIQVGEVNTIIYLKFDTFDNNKEKTWFWKHGQAGIITTEDKIRPCNWYGKQHPFEFEIIVVDNPATHKIFTDLQIIANKAKPESLHFEISGEVYNFANDKKNMFFRQEAIKHLYQYNGGDIVYNPNYLNIITEQRDILGRSVNNNIKDKSTQFPLYYSKVDTINEVEDYYQGMSDLNKDYQRMSGSEIVYDSVTNQYNIATHIKACPFKEYYYQKISKDKYKEEYNNFIKVTNSDNSVDYFEIKTYGRLNGNMDYLEDRWFMQIPPIVYKQKNEKAWITTNDDNHYPPLSLYNNPLPESMSSLDTSQTIEIPKNLKDLGYTNNSFDCNDWGNTKETRIRDKYIKVKVRYSGEDLAIIYAIITSYTISYA